MRVLQINAVYEKFSTGRTTKELHEDLLKRGIESYVACSDISNLIENSYKIGNTQDQKLHAILSRVSGKQAYFSKKATKQLIKYIEYVNPDIIHLRNLHSNYINFPMLMKYISDTKKAVVITLHDSWFYTGKCVYYVECNCKRWKKKCGKCPALTLGNPSLFLDRSRAMLKDKNKYFSMIDKLAVIGVSKWVTDDASESILKNATIIKCIYNWIDLDLFKPQKTDELKKDMGLENKFIIFGVAMAWNTQKGIDVFNNLADILPDDCQIVLAGGTDSVEYKNPKIKFIGNISDTTTLAKLYSLSDVFVNPTIQETFGKTTAEAMSCGTPVVAYNGTATVELLGDDNSCGYLIDQNDAKLYLDAILNIKANQGMQYEKATRKRAEEMFSKDGNILQYIEVYNELLEI